ncbi:MAG TPA: hypothetical protein VG939_03280 [Caulobacteraceae bacterium]|nr:hypothetical protein [Caulobacteraceae bacterium]
MRTIGAIIGLAAGLGCSAEACAADLAALTPGQRQRAECLVSSLGAIRQISRPSLTVTDDPRLHVILRYDYRHRHTGKVDEAGPFDVTGLLTPNPRRTVRLPGVVALDRNDFYRGVFQVWDIWQSRCGIGAQVVAIGGSDAVFTGMPDQR